MNYRAYKLHFTFKRWHFEEGVKVAKTHNFERVVLAGGVEEATEIARKICRESEDVSCMFAGVTRVEAGKVWKVTMDGTAHLRNSEDKLVDREDMHKVTFVDAFDMNDAEQIAYRIWERQVTEEGWSDISIYRTMVEAHDKEGKEE